MMMRFLAAAAAVMLAAPAQADWQTEQREGYARASYAQGDYEVWISCRPGRGFELSLLDRTLSGRDFQGVQSLMMWVKLPDGRTDRWPVEVMQEGPSMSGRLVVSDFNLEFFRNAASFELDSPQTRQMFLSGNANGTGAARLAFLERCEL